MNLGFDPEVFITNFDGELLLPNNFTNGQKGNAQFFATTGLLCDGVAVEVNTVSPAGGEKAFRTMLDTAFATVRRRCVPGILSTSSVIDLPRSILNTEQAQELGCEPDYCVYRGQMMRPMTARRLGSKRYAGGHLHVSEYNAIDPHRWAKMIDIFLGSWLCFNDGPERRQFIGAGRIRIKGEAYIEYRVPSNLWFFHPEWATHIWNSMAAATAHAQATTITEEHLKEVEPLVLAAIDNGDIKARDLLWQRFNITDPRVAA